MTDPARYGPWAVIAGGSEGVGAEFAAQLARDGINLVLIARKTAPLDETARRCRDLGAQVRTIPTDLLEPESISHIATGTADLEVGLLIYNAGANTCREQFLDADLAAVAKVIDLNVSRMLELVQHFGRPLRERRRGGIILVGSLAGTYERLILDAMRGEATLFTRNDEVIAQWSIIDPILKAWREHDDEPLHEYASGSAGPEAADELIAPRKWRGL